MLKGFFDESNRNPSEVQFIMAGWIATVEEWENFSEAWQECLSRSPKVEFFKSSNAKCDVKRLPLARLIAGHQMRGYVFTAKHDLLASKPKELSLLRGIVGMRIYDWAFIKTISTVVTDFLDRAGPSDKIDFIFDECKELGACIDSYSEEKKKWPPSMQHVAGIIGPGNDEELAGIQAADLLAGEHSDYLRTTIRSSAYTELAKTHILESAASPPLVLETFLQYAKDVQARAESVHGMIKILKQHGVNLDDFKDK
jgi:hypothetical protein